VTRLQEALGRLVADLRELDFDWAVVGGLAVSARAEPRTTRDVDVAVAVDGDRQAEQVVSRLTARGYLIEAVLEHKLTGRMATVRLRAPGESLRGVLIDLFFASSGVEAEVVAAADLLELWPGMSVPVATTGHLLALKILASRPKDLEDFQWLLEEADAGELRRAHETLALITERGFDRDKDLLRRFEIEQARASAPGCFVERKPGKT
jgi:predicted nucleotidyltransferase